MLRIPLGVCGWMSTVGLAGKGHVCEGARCPALPADTRCLLEVSTELL